MIVRQSESALMTYDPTFPIGLAALSGHLVRSIRSLGEMLEGNSKWMQESWARCGWASVGEKGEMRWEGRNWEGREFETLV